MVDCNKCKHLNITEKEQTDKKEVHICLKYNKRVFHNSYKHIKHREFLYPCKMCENNNYESYENR